MEVGTVTLTFGECAENFAGMQKIGEKSSTGFSLEDLHRIKNTFPDITEIYDLNYLLPQGTYVEMAYVLVIRNPFKDIADQLYTILNSPEQLDTNGNLGGLAWDKHKFMYGRVVNSIARYNLCFADLGNEYKILPKYEEKRGTIYNFRKIPQLEWLLNQISALLPGPFLVEGNNYYNSERCYIGMHRDNERSKTVGYRVGNSFPIQFRWYHGTQQIPYLINGIQQSNNYASIQLNHGDMYVMTSISSGTVKDRSGLYLKHSAGSAKEATAK